MRSGEAGVDERKELPEEVPVGNGGLARPMLLK